MNNVTSANRLRHILVSAVLLAGAVAALPSQAATPDGPLSVKVDYSDLNLSHPAGVKVLYTRIQSAAQKVCAPLSGNRDLSLADAWAQCLSDAVSGAVQSVDQPALTSVYEEKTGKTIPTRFASLQSR
jgi:UrcA family protein